MNLLLDTSGLIHFFANQPHAAQIVAQADRLLIPSIVLGEWLSGVDTSSRKGQLLARFLESPRASVLVVDGDTAVFYSHLVQFLRRKGSPVPTNDLWIAACAMQVGARILTSDRHFLRMPQVLTEFIGR